MSEEVLKPGHIIIMENLESLSEEVKGIIKKSEALNPSNSEEHAQAAAYGLRAIELEGQVALLTDMLFSTIIPDDSIKEFERVVKKVIDDYSSTSDGTEMHNYVSKLMNSVRSEVH